MYKSTCMLGNNKATLGDLEKKRRDREREERERERERERE
jgi:hypothetical protein